MLKRVGDFCNKFPTLQEPLDAKSKDEGLTMSYEGLSKDYYLKEAEK